MSTVNGAQQIGAKVDPARRIRVLVVDDSAFMRTAISKMIRSDPALEVVDTARDGQEAIEKVAALKPDVMTLDVEMPRLDGISALRRIMAETPLPVIMVSSLTNDGAQATFDALDIGAVDYIPKQLSYVSIDIVKIKEQLIQKIKAAAASRRFRRRVAPSPATRADPTRPASMPPTSPAQIRPPTHPLTIVAIGTSTGGPKALQELLPRLPADFPVGIVIVQHMPAAFTGPFAQRLNGLSKIEVKEAAEGDEVLPGLVLIAPGSHHVLLSRHGLARYGIKLTDEPSNLLHKPAVDVMMLSVAEYMGRSALGVILTGMGNDGLRGMAMIKQKGGYTIAQDEESCVVYGMPKAIVDGRLADLVVPLEYLASSIMGFFARSS